MLASAAAKPEGYVLATDYDPEILEQARRGGPFSARDVSNLSAAQLAAHFEPGGPPYFVKSSLRNAVRFEQHDVRSQPPSQDFDLLLYRNVEPFFSAIENIEIYRRLSAAIRPGGLLFIGACERVALGHGLPFRQVGDSLYQRTE
jgi:chemotaxis protein methyltransferase CheR